MPVPETLRPTLGPPLQEQARSWLVNPLLAPRWVWLASIGPAVLVAVLVFLDQNITARLINKPDHKLQRGEAYHMDLAVMGVLMKPGQMTDTRTPWAARLPRRPSP